MTDQATAISKRDDVESLYTCRPSVSLSLPPELAWTSPLQLFLLSFPAFFITQLLRYSSTQSLFSVLPVIPSNMSTRKRKQDAEEEEELQALPSDESDEEEE